MRNRKYSQVVAGSSLIVALALFATPGALAHCDTMDGPVVVAARAALEAKDVTPVLKWVASEAEPEVRAAFTKALAVRSRGTEARELADQFFFETLVRVHRAGEGASYTGLKPAGAEVSPVIEQADKSLSGGSANALIQLVTEEAAAGIARRFAEVQEKKLRAEQSVEAGRSFVAAYVEYVHYVEGLDKAARQSGAHSPRHAESTSDRSTARGVTEQHSAQAASTSANSKQQVAQPVVAFTHIVPEKAPGELPNGAQSASALFQIPAGSNAEFEIFVAPKPGAESSEDLRVGVSAPAGQPRAVRLEWSMGPERAEGEVSVPACQVVLRDAVNGAEIRHMRLPISPMAIWKPVAVEPARVRLGDGHEAVLMEGEAPSADGTTWTLKLYYSAQPEES
jgi:hypothetical protein